LLSEGENNSQPSVVVDHPESLRLTGKKKKIARVVEVLMTTLRSNFPMWWKKKMKIVSNTAPTLNRIFLDKNTFSEVVCSDEEFS
jgi:hypothetical protein